MTIAPAERVETSLEEIAALDFEPEVPCEAEGCPDEARAEWYLVPNCRCGHTIATCSDCKAYTQNNVAEGVMLWCSRCGTSNVAVRFEPLR